MTEEEDIYAVSSDSDDEDSRKPPPKIQIEGRQNTDINQLKSAITETKGPVKDEAREEELEQLKQAAEIKKMKQEFEEGKVASSAEEELQAVKAAMEEERQKLTEIGKEKYSKFKDRFENLDSTLDENLEERLKRMEREIIGVGKETLANSKERFEKGIEDSAVVREKVEIERSADLQKMKSAFTRDMTADEAPKECAVCGKTVYPVERVFANKQLYHNQCFKCSKCEKKLTPTNYNSQQGALLCKVHMLEVFHPEIAKTMDPANTEEDEHVEDTDDDEFAVSNKPKHLQGVVKSGTSAVQDELAQITSLKSKKGDFESAAKEAANIEKLTKVEDEVLRSGKVKANKERFLAGELEDESEEEEEGERDPNIIREDKKKKKQELHFAQVDDLKNKWKTGDVETAEQKEGKENKDLELLKTGPSVKERFQERNEADEVVERQWDRSELDTAGIAKARESFMQGSAYETNAVEKSAKDLDELQFKQLQNFKERFEKGEGEADIQKTEVDLGGDLHLEGIKAAFEQGEEEMSPEERAALKKKEIEAEFQRYKLARRAAAERAKKEAEQGITPGEGAADVGSIKDRFDKGEAFKSQGADGKELDVEIKMAGKAREKFMQIDASGATPVVPNVKKHEPSKWDKKEGPVAEVINRRVVEDYDEPEDEDAFDVKNLMNKFKHIGETSATSAISEEQRAELEAIKSQAAKQASNIKQRFEQGIDDDADMAEEKRRQMQEEFERLKREREEAQKRLEEERALELQQQHEVEKEDVAIKADHASKMAAKWEKLQAKEAKKAEKSRMPEKKTTADQ
uniref:LIM domain protein variant n=1 Tax=Cyathostominae sp. JM-2007a TaxID=456246 RepID=A7LGW9_9BILA|nr:LIM domain protein variant [Cyathostominae sp. JM-2007a]